MLNSSLTSKKRKSPGQAMLEFALALPVLLMVVYGLLETGRLLFIYASVVTAARQAARYGAASGDIGSGTLYYQDCAGIRGAAKAVGFLQPFTNADIEIAYDTGPGTAVVVTDSPSAGGTDCPISTISDNQHRIDVRVSTLFTPIVPLVPFRPFVISSTSNRTILTGVSIAIPNAGLPAASSSGGEITVTKSPSRANFDTAGQVITYTYTVTNNGTGDVTGLQLFDDHIGGGATDLYCGADPLHGGSPPVTCTASYTVTQADVDSAAAIVNSATVRAFDDAGNPLAATVSASVAFQALPKLHLDKSGELLGVVDAGTQIKYTFILTNTGNIDLHDPFTLTDSLALTNLSCPTGTIPAAKVGVPAGTATCTGYYALKQADVNAGYVDNTATATAKFGAAGTISSNQATAHVPTPKLWVALSTDKTSVSQVGETIRYYFDLKNNTANTLTNLTVTDTRGANKLACLGSLAPGALATKACYHDYSTTQPDLDAGPILTNSATASAQGSVNSNLATNSVTVNQNPVIVVNKTSTTCQPAGTTCTVGQQITYSYSMTNTGNVTLKPTATTPFTITDDKIPGLPAGCSVTSGSFAPGATIISSASCTRTYSGITQADIDAGSIVNTATGSGVFGSTPLTVTKPYTLQTFYGARLTILKSADKTYFTASTQTITYTYGIKNTGSVDLTLSTPFDLSDSWLAAITPTCAGGALAPGALQACGTATYTTVDSDIVVQNTVSPAAGMTVTPASGTATIVNGQWTVSKLSCTPGSLTFSLSPASGTSINVDFTNTTGAAVPVQSGSLTWTGGGNLTGFNFGSGTSLWPTGSSTYTIPGGWSIPSGSSTATMTFSVSVSGVSMSLSFPTDTGCAPLP